MMLRYKYTLQIIFVLSNGQANPLFSITALYSLSEAFNIYLTKLAYTLTLY